MLRILFIGDIVGKLGRVTVENLLPSLKKSARVDLVLANSENLSHGKGATREKIEEMQRLGIDAFTSGNHIFHVEGFEDDIDSLPVIRPTNWPKGVAGKDRLVVDTGKKGKVLLLNFVGRVFMDDACAENAFLLAESVLKMEEKNDYAAILIDFHAEATSEKAAFAHNLDGRVSAVFGTHTHVATADARVLPKGTAFVTDVGMVGALNSSLGVALESVIPTYKLPYPAKFSWVEDGPAVFNSVLVEVDKGRAISIERIDKVLKEV